MGPSLTWAHQRRNKEKQAKFGCEMSAERYPQNIHVEAASWSIERKLSGHEDLTGLSRTMEQPGSG